MGEPRKRADWPVVVGAGVVLVLLLAAGRAYIGCYYAMSRASGPSLAGPGQVRIYDARWQAVLFTPSTSDLAEP